MKLNNIIWKDIINNSNLWCGLRFEIDKEIKGAYQLESGNNYRFKLQNNTKSILWGTFGIEYWGVWILQDKSESILENVPINATTIETSKSKDYYTFWSRFFAKHLSQSVLSGGLWSITIGSSFEDRKKNTSEIIYDINNAFEKENPRWIEWDIGKCGSIVALKNEPSKDDGRVKWYRKLIRDEFCPPILAWYLSCIKGYIILDGHSRLKAFQLESIPPKFLVLNSIIEEEIKRDPNVQKNIWLALEKRQNNPVKPKMNIEEVNKVLISAFDTRPFYRPITNTKARHNYEEQWISEVRSHGNKLALNSNDIEDMIERLEN